MSTPDNTLVRPNAELQVTTPARSRKFLFADECGNFDFSRATGASRYFILVTVVMPECSVAHSLLDLRRELAWEGLGLETEFHATADLQAVRDRVFATIEPHPFRVDATIIDKRRAQPSIRTTDERFYQYAWFYHLKYLAPRIVRRDEDLLVVGSSLGTKKKRAGFLSAIGDVVGQVSPTTTYKAASWSGDSDPCLLVADYCAWAIQRKWETADSRSYVLIQSKIKSEFPLFANGAVEYY